MCGGNACYYGECCKIFIMNWKFLVLLPKGSKTIVLFWHFLVISGNDVLNVKIGSLETCQKIKWLKDWEKF